jgi:hypothetical protein
MMEKIRENGDWKKNDIVVELNILQAVKWTWKHNKKQYANI